MKVLAIVAGKTNNVLDGNLNLKQFEGFLTEVKEYKIDDDYSLLQFGEWEYIVLKYKDKILEGYPIRDEDTFLVVEEEEKLRLYRNMKVNINVNNLEDLFDGKTLTKEELDHLIENPKIVMIKFEGGLNDILYQYSIITTDNEFKVFVKKEK